LVLGWIERPAAWAALNLLQDFRQMKAIHLAFQAAKRHGKEKNFA
jgi:hypothetical protein